MRAVWVVPARVRKTGLLLHHATSPALRACVVLSVMNVIPPHSDGCDTSPTETLRNLHLTGSRYLLQIADGSLDI